MTSALRDAADSAELAGFVAQRLQETADKLVADWIAWVRARVENPTVDALPERALLNHIPPVINAITHYVVSPSYALREEMLGHLKLHGQVRRDQGYEATDVMAEFDGLAHMIFRAMQSEVEGLKKSVSSSAVLDVFGRLADGLRAMSYVTLAVYQQAADERQRELATKLNNFGRAISHELRNPLHTIALAAKVLAEAGAGESKVVASQVDAIQRALDHALGLVDDIGILALAQGSAYRTRMVPLPRVMEDIRAQLAVRAAEREVQLDFEGEIPRVAIEGLVGTLALVNLITNGIKYADKGKPVQWVKIRTRLIQGPETPVVEIEVTDNGLGIPPDLQPRVFQRGFRAHPEHAEGTGLGLSLTQELLVERGGSITLESTEGKGTKVVARLRAIDAESVEVSSRGRRPEGIMDRAVQMVLQPYEGVGGPNAEAPQLDLER